MATSRTFGPLHFEDLEPKRFEDLVRQLIYDFKNWRRLEATGRAGSDDGFDARGYEILANREITDDESDEGVEASLSDRLWLVQCKREKTIPPKKLSGYMDQIRLSESEPLHGVLFVAACDFSKASRDAFRQKCEAFGVQEWHLWGKAELEDQLFQPKNDHLLFAYFGFSLTIRRRTKKTELGQLLVTKRKAHRVLSDKLHARLLLRDVNAENYPSLANSDAARPPWLTYQFREFHASGLIFVVNRYFAYLSPDPLEWDAAFSLNDAHSRDAWSEDGGNHTSRNDIFEFWNTLPKGNQGWFDILAVVPYHRIIAIDELGDNYHGEPHIYVEFNGSMGPFAGYAPRISSGGQWDRFEFLPASLEERRVVKFPVEMRRLVNPGPYSPKRLLGP